MPAAYYLDTSVLLPRLLRGAPGYAWVNALCDPAQGNLIAIAEITEAEVVAALHQLARGGTLKRKRIETALALFWDQVDQGQYAVYPSPPLSSGKRRRYARVTRSKDMTPYN